MAVESRADPFHELTDVALVHLIVNDGSESAFRTMYRRHSPQLRRVALRMLASEAEADDVLQETWLRATDRLKGFEWRSTLSTWLTGIAVNIARELLESRGRWSSVELEDEMIESAAVSVDEPIDLDRALRLLPAGCRTAFLLHDVEGYTHEEIAAQLGYSAGTSKTQVFRARRAIRRFLNGAETKENEHA